MKNKLIYLCLPLLFIGSYAYCLTPSSEFYTERLEHTYTLLPETTKQQIKQQTTDIILPTYDIENLSETRICFNNDKVITHLGFYLFQNVPNESEIVYYFIENTLLTLRLLNQTSLITKELKNRKIVITENNRVHQNLMEKYEDIPFELFFKDYTFSINHEDNHFTIRWNFDNGRQLTWKFPSDINLIKGMNKQALETELFKNLTSFITSNESKIENENYNSSNLISLPSGLFMQQGSSFETDNFRSDIYLKKGRNNFKPVYSSQYQAESFSNLFICNLPTTLQIQLTQIFYAYAKDSALVSTNNLIEFLSEEHEIYFGLHSTYDEHTLKASIIYYHPTYKYIHLLVVETDKNVLFTNNKKNTIQGELYAFIPCNQVDSLLNKKL